MARTKDFLLVHDSGGATVKDGIGVSGDALSNMVYTALEVVRGSFLADETYGSDLLEVRKATAGGAKLAQRYAENALAHLISRGIIATVDVTTRLDEHKGGIDLFIRCAGGRLGAEGRVFKHWVGF